MEGDKYGVRITHDAHLAEPKAMRGATAPRPASDIDTVHEVLSFANTLASRALALADAACGCAPQSGQSDKAIVDDGVLPRVVTAAMHTRGRLGDAMEALGRIERSLGVVG